MANGSGAFSSCSSLTNPFFSILSQAYADKFLSQSIPCVICDVAPLDGALSSLKKKYPSMSDKVHGVKCDVSSSEDVDNLASFAKEKVSQREIGSPTHQHLLTLALPALTGFPTHKSRTSRTSLAL